MSAESRRILWRCRRGLLEMDLVLELFIEKHFEALTAAQLKTLDTMLGYTDNELWDLVTYRAETDDTDMQALLGMMRGAASLRIDERETAGHEH
ncbi:antitoxin CptB [Novimethylophilus kurashikiensis]|uniref:FAD assembly factor SdhE n=1 Tax=Novimethylophilus kurashikiensis TaxID=1825523 RepID=A0A2R5F8S1_9PROT|nr:succinate dehydrogenase assembly factor 2 [Novimethylophilus kurashikiensis]GBG14626.1 antitoxin CptB [Novimethylophilus kurashikiensis]